MFAVVSTHPTFSQRVKPMILAACLALSLMIGAGATATRVGAQPVGPGIDGVSQACRSLQGQAQSLIDEYGRIGRANPNDPQLDVILAQLRSIGADWQRIGCQSGFGRIAVTPAPLPGRGVIGYVFAGGATTARANG